MEKRPALGKGLSALIPDAPEPPRASPVEVDIDRLDAERLPAARPRRRRAARGAGAVDQRQRHHPADRRPRESATASRSSPASAAGAPRSAPACSRVPVVVRDVAAGQGAVAARDGAHREHPARGSEPDRRSARLPAPGRRVPADAGRHRGRGRQGPRVGRQLPAAAEAAGRSARRGRGRPPVDGPRARAARRSPTRPISGASRATSSRAASRCARPKRSSRRSSRRGAAARSRRRRSRPTSTRAPPKSGCSSLLGTRVRIVRRGTRGRIEIDFVSEDELIRIYEQLTER